MMVAVRGVRKCSAGKGRRLPQIPWVTPLSAGWGKELKHHSPYKEIRGMSSLAEGVGFFKEGDRSPKEINQEEGKEKTEEGTADDLADTMTNSFLEAGEAIFLNI